jgi:hypothetical protein
MGTGVKDFFIKPV